MVWLLLAINFLTLLVCWLFHHLMVSDLRKDHERQRATWEHKEERLLNRCMTKDWQSYVQMNGAMQVASSTSEPGEGIGMSDESEARRWAEAHGIPEFGEVLAEQDLHDLGLHE